MKKLITVFFAMIILAIPTTAFAESYAGSGQTEIVAHEYSTYTITIPEQINLETDGNIPITLSNANIESGYKVVVSATNLTDGKLPLFHSDGSNEEKDIYIFNADTGNNLSEDNTMATFEEESFNVEETYEKTVAFSPVEAYGLKAGIYTGYLNYSFQCVPVD